MTQPRLTGLSLPIAFEALGFPAVWSAGGVTLQHGDPAWSWQPGAPAMSIAAADEPAQGHDKPGWALDHVVVLVPDLGATEEKFSAVGLVPALKMTVAGRPTAFYRAGAEIEVIESPVRGEALYGIALVTEEQLEVVVLRWRALGRDVGDPQPAIQPDRRIFTVRDVEAGLAVMSPPRAAIQTPKMS